MDPFYNIYFHITPYMFFKTNNKILKDAVSSCSIKVRIANSITITPFLGILTPTKPPTSPAPNDKVPFRAPNIVSFTNCLKDQVLYGLTALLKEYPAPAVI